MKTLLLLISFFLFLKVNSQIDIVGKWKVNNYTGFVDSYSQTEHYSRNRTEYRLTKSDSLGTKWINLINNKFENNENCYVNQGSYRMLGDKHVQFYLEQYDGDCAYGIYSPVITLGPFFIVKDFVGIRLIKSDLDVKKDSVNLEYSNKIDFFDKKILTDFNFDSIIMRPSDAVSDLDIVSDCINDQFGFNIKDISVLYSKKIRYTGLKVILFERKEELFFVVVSQIKDNTIDIVYPKKKVCLFKKSFQQLCE